MLALGIYGLWVNSEVRDWVPTIGLSTIFALAPGTLLQNLELLSEFPYLMLTLTALWLAERGRITTRGCGTAALCVGLATVTRTAGLSLLVAFAIWLFDIAPGQGEMAAVAHRVNGFCHRSGYRPAKVVLDVLVVAWEQSQTTRAFWRLPRASRVFGGMRC